jgi:Nif-specific regulatory protein
MKTTGLERKLLETRTLYEISKALNSSLDLSVTLKQILEIMHKHMSMERGTITLLDQKTQELSIHVAQGMLPHQAKRGRYKIGEGITGRVVETGEPIVVENVGAEPRFLDRTGARGDIKKKNISFICVPIKVEGKTTGALSVDRLFGDSVSLREDERLLSIISSIISQSVRLWKMVNREKQALIGENLELKRELKELYHPEEIVGTGKKMQEVHHTVSLVAPTKATVLLRGESGTGKELVARAIHYHSPRAEKPFVKFSCAALPEGLLESELFGYDKGAFTGAVGAKPGRFEIADGGTIFLDEIGDVSLTTQAKLLRVLQEKKFERVGGLHTYEVDVRVIAATNKDLEAAVREGNFREDLYYRLNVLPIFLPPLRDRREDIPLLVEHFIERFCREYRKEIQGLTEKVWEYVKRYHWPGNVRELENFVERAVIVCQGDRIDGMDLPAPMQNGKTVSREAAASTLPEAVALLEKRLIRDALDRTSGNRRKAAALLGVTERILGYKLKSYPDLAGE